MAERVEAYYKGSFTSEPKVSGKYLQQTMEVTSLEQSIILVAVLNECTLFKGAILGNSMAS